MVVCLIEVEALEGKAIGSCGIKKEINSTWTEGTIEKRDLAEGPAGSDGSSESQALLRLMPRLGS